MNIQLGLRTLGLVVLVIASTAVLVRPELIGGSTSATAPVLVSLLAVGHN